MDDELKHLRGLLRDEYRLHRFTAAPWSCDTADCVYAGQPMAKSCECYRERLVAHNEAVRRAIGIEMDGA